jgi:putative membrane protein insertion efficiency factor
MKRVLLVLLAFYRWCISPLLHALMPGGCKFEPTCSRYAAEAIEMHGAAQGGWMTLRRLLRCHPFTRGGFDPVPLPNATGHTQSKTSASLEALHNPLP